MTLEELKVAISQIGTNIQSIVSDIDALENYSDPRSALVDSINSKVQGLASSVNIPSPAISSTPKPDPTPAPAPVTENLIANPGFDSIDSWVFHTDGEGSLSVNIPDHVESSSGKIVIDQPGSNVQLYQSGIQLEAGSKYRLTFYAYCNTGHGFSVSIQKHTTPYTNFGLSYTASLTTSWAKYLVEFTASGFTGTTTDTRLMFWLADTDAAGDNFFIDDVSLVKIDSVVPPPPVSTVPTIMVGSVNGIAGSDVDVPITFTVGETGVDTLQFDLTLPTGITYKSIKSGAVSDAAGKSVQANQIGNNLRVLVFGLNQNTLGTGVMATVTLTLASGLSGTQTIGITGIVSADSNAVQVATNGIGGGIKL